MEKTSPARKEHSHRFVKELPFYLFVGTMAALTIIDFASHPDFGIANMETRHQFIHTFGPWVKHVGNYGISAGIGACLGTAKYVLDHGKFDKLSGGSKLALAIGLNINPVIESFSPNNELFGDVSFGTAGLLMGYAFSQAICGKIDLAIHPKKQ